jgi:peptide-methionine (S)-S-oxide reductase
MEGSIRMQSDELILGGGCFWCLEPIFHRLKGVLSAESGYCGGHVEHPSYAQVCEATTGHAEVLRVRFDPATVSLETLLELFFTFHDPTSFNRQGNDVGPQYRSVLFYADATRKAQFEAVMARLQAEGLWGRKFVTRLEPAATFYPAEDYHQRYFETHGHEPYCAYVIDPKVQKLRARYAELLKDPEA